MRILTGILAVMVGCTVAFAQKEVSETDLAVKALKKHVKLGSVTSANERDELGGKWEVITTTTYQDEDDPFIGTLRLTVEFRDKDRNMHYGQAKVTQRAHINDYAGKDDWRFRVPHGELSYPKLTAYIMEYGFETNETFVAVSQVTKNANTADEIIKRNEEKGKKLKFNGISLKQYTRSEQ